MYLQYWLEDPKEIHVCTWAHAPHVGPRPPRGPTPPTWRYLILISIKCPEINCLNAAQKPFSAVL